MSSDKPREPRKLCRCCRKDTRTCYCERIRPFSAAARFVILMHPKEVRKKVGTGRLTHRCITNSLLLEGIDFTNDAQVNALLADPTVFPVVLYPGPFALEVGPKAGSRLEQVVPEGAGLTIFVIDASWSCAKKILRLSDNLKRLTQMRFTPTTPSAYRIRRQPHAICFSTVEAVHFIIEGLAHSARWPAPENNAHANLLEVFQSMIDQQLSHVRRPRQKAARGLRRVEQRNV